MRDRADTMTEGLLELIGAAKPEARVAWAMRCPNREKPSTWQRA